MISMLIIIAVPIVGAILLTVLGRANSARMGKSAGYIAGGLSLATVIATFILLAALNRGEDPILTLNWAPMPGVVLGLHCDWITLPFLVTETIVTFLAIVYAWGYHHMDERTPYFYALLLVFGAAMSGTTLADDMVLFYTFWELMLIASAVLILVWGETPPGGPDRRTVTLKYVIFTHLGSLLVLIALLTIYNTVGNDSFSSLRQGLSLPTALVPTVTTLFLIGFGVKMAVFPVHIWLPDAHTVAPMPVTIMLAAAMLAMGTYGILRFPFSLFSQAQMARFGLPLMIIGVISEIYGALMAFAEKDIKRIIAYSSVSQMGYILFGLGTLTYDGIAGATLHVIFHAIVKALLFMVTGLIIHSTGRRQLDELGGLRNHMPTTTACAAIGVLALASVPPLCMFDSEWMLFSGGMSSGRLGISAISLLGSLLTVAYALWFAGRIFFGDLPVDLQVKKRPLAMLIPAVFLTVLTVVEGIFPAPLFDWVAHEITLLLGGGLR
ncbi:MAG: NADH-quinone oxidoreductase subunit M [Anaerolineae bacterium]|nr:NADH-quinone oxidoreductase subunit M [Anaerolineae bacterium]